MADGVRPVSPVAARGRVAQDPVPVAGPRGRGRSDHVGCVGGLHRRPGPPARRWGAKKGNFKSNRQAEQELPNLTITRWEGSRGGLTTKTHLACEQGQKTLAVVITAGQRGDSPQFTTVLDAISVPRIGPGRPRRTPDRVLADKAYSSGRNLAWLH